MRRMRKIIKEAIWSNFQDIIGKEKYSAEMYV